MRNAVCGLIGPSCTSKARTLWNARFKESGVPAFFDFYRTKTKEDLELRLSEMFLLERRGYVVVPELQALIQPLLDRLDSSVQQSGIVDTVLNERGVLTGFFCVDNVEKRMEVWFGSGSS